MDSIVNLAFVYGLLTSALAGVFAAMITFTQRMFLTITGQQNDNIAIVITTLIVAATFTPLKAAIESLVTRQFRDTYDQTRNLRAYGDQVQAFLPTPMSTATACIVSRSWPAWHRWVAWRIVST